MDDNNSQSKSSISASGLSNSTSDQAPHVKSSNNQHSSQATSSSNDLFVYIPDIPTNILDNELEEMIQTRIDNILRIKISDIKCYSNLGVAVIRLMNENDKKHLVSTVRSIVLDVEHNTNISFVDELDLTSYIVLDQNISKIHAAEEVARRYMQVYKTSDLRSCQQISVQFPNIFSFSLDTFDELVKGVKNTDFKIESTFATIYLRADCIYFEDLPPNTNDDKILLAIATQIDENKLQPTSFYVQYNKQTGNAVVLATQLNKKWIKESVLIIDGKNISKKTKLTYRVLVFPVPHGFNIDQILKHKLFGRIVASHHINDHIILELDDMNCYDNCLSVGALRFGNIMMQIVRHTLAADPDKTEITAENWYETEMFNIKPDIMTLIRNPQHPIFRYKWNAQLWIEQMKKIDVTDRRSKKYDLNRHLLRVTVMLNTIGVVRKKKYAVDGEEIILKSEPMKTIGYNHKSKLSYGKTIAQTDMKTPYPLTNVIVINEDCLVLYEKLVSEGYRPLLLNMANATNPGGGYRKGDGAQEENLFRRSDYYQSLDVDVADEDRSERLYCTSNCEFKQITTSDEYYPMKEFGAIYTSGITVFRQEEANGYAFMKNPLYNVCAIAMAAYRDPELTKENMLEKKFVINTHKKIENIFAIAYHHKHDCLVLSAFGCGAFKNPPEHIALLFKSVIYQYAGFFKTIYFAIVDDHNTGNQINPDGNFLPFTKILHGLHAQPPTTIRVNGVSGPNRILNKSSDGKLNLSDACILYLQLCQHGSKCHELKNSQHNNNYLHPPICSYQDATSSCEQMDDEVHMFTFLHNIKCQYGGQCNDKDPKHLSEYDHPDYCIDGGDCQNVHQEHLLAYRHLPLCSNGFNCSKYLKRDNDHCKEFRHCKSICPYDNCCVQFHDKQHFENTIHSFRLPCPFTPYNCSMYVEFMQTGNTNKISSEVENHCYKYSHVCPFGRQCKTKDEKHFEISIHIARKMCSNVDKCSQLTDEEHLESFSHPGIRDIRLFCREPGFKCSDRLKNEHLKKYRHGKNHNHLSAVQSTNLNSSINFVRNQSQLIRTVNNYVDVSNWKKSKISPEILNWIQALQPVHRCAPHIFESILVHGHVMSRHYMNLLKQPAYVAKAVRQHGRIRLIFLKHNIPAVKDNAFRLITALVEAEFAKSKASSGTTPLSDDHDYTMKVIEKKLIPPLTDHDINIIHQWSKKIAQESIKLHQNPMGIGYVVDQTLGTDKHVFSILGPHLGHYYGDIIIVFKKEIMFHPDANFSIQAGTSFGPSGNAYKHRSWLKDPGSGDKRVANFHNSKLHCSIPRYAYAAATELMALTGKNKQSMDVTLKDIVDRWMTVDSHEVFEGHLPQLIPLDYIEYVFIPKNLFQSLTLEAQQSAKAAFKDALFITNHDIDLSLIKPGGIIPLDATRQPYQKFVLDKIFKKIEQKFNEPQIAHGIVITIPASKFEELIVLPITISQSYTLYCLQKAQTSNNPELTYIYWQAMNGDMMLTISNEEISPEKDQSNLRCLICYVAEKSSTSTEDYHEAYSYLNYGSPYQHETNVHTNQFKAKSSVLYRGCNTDDFFTFCLKISHKTGEVTLSHAGPNGIYNHEKIQYRFSKSELDLSSIDFIYVSAGNQDVPIRNLMINHEPMSALHPTFDKDFKIDTSNLLKKHQTGHYYPGVASSTVATHINDITPKSNIKQAASSVQLPAKTENISIFKRIKNALFGSFVDVNASMSNSTTLQPQPKVSSKLPPCRDSVYCLNQNSKDHINKYSHPCRFSELCRNKDNEPHLVHERHNISKCLEDEKCSLTIASYLKPYSTLMI
ncbi:unnamed protein product [Rotaria sp. Silwood2]|nr:unnamed protein product [Rotaria sp. Silwood2]